MISVLFRCAATLLSLFPIVVLANPLLPPWQAPTQWPDRIIATVTDDPTRSFAVTWRTNQLVGETIAQIALATPDARFDLNADTQTATSELVHLDHVMGPNGKFPFIYNQGLEPVIHHSVKFTDLQPNTLYAYRVRGARGMWSPWYQLQTAPAEGKIQFVFFGDAQTSIRSHVSRTIAAAYKAAPDAQFYVHGGDLTNKGTYDKEWAEWFAAGGRSYKMVPSLPVPGNHDYINFTPPEITDRRLRKLFQAPRAVTNVWRPQFNLPLSPDLPPDLQETTYQVRYNRDLHIFAIDSSGIEFDKQMTWLDKNLKASDASWKVVTMHHPLYSFVGGREHPAAKKRRTALLKVLRENDIDLVITGHRHTYQRAARGDELERFSIGDAQEVDTVFVITASSTKRGDTKVEGWERYARETDQEFKLTRYGNKTPIFSVVNIEGNQMRIESIDPLGQIYDAFTLTKSNGKKILNGTLNGG